MLKKRLKEIEKDLNKGEEIYLELNSGRYKGSILKLEKVLKNRYWWNDRLRHKCLLNAPGLVRRLSVDPKDLSETNETQTHLTNTPNITKKQNLPRDFVDTLIDVDDYLFGKGSLIQIVTISAHNQLEAKCIMSTNDEIKVGKIKRYNSMKKFLKIDDPIKIFLRIQNEKIK